MTYIFVVVDQSEQGDGLFIAAFTTPDEADEFADRIGPASVLSVPLFVSADVGGRR